MIAVLIILQGVPSDQRRQLQWCLARAPLNVVLDVIIIHLAGAPRWRVLSEVPLFRIAVLISIRGMMLGNFRGVFLLGRLLEFPEDHAGGI